MQFARKFNDLHEFSVRRNAAKDQAVTLERWPKLGIEFITVPVTFTDFRGARVDFARQRSFRQQTGPRAKTHSAAQLLNVNQIAQLENNRMWRVQIELSRIGVLVTADIPGILDASRLHTQANTKIRSAGFSGIRYRPNHSLDATLAKAPRNENGVKVAQQRFVIVFHQFFGFNPLDFDAQIVAHPAMR